MSYSGALQRTQNTQHQCILHCTSIPNACIVSSRCILLPVELVLTPMSLQGSKSFALPLFTPSFLLSLWWAFVLVKPLDFYFRVFREIVTCFKLRLYIHSRLPLTNQVNIKSYRGPRENSVAEAIFSIPEPSRPSRIPHWAKYWACFCQWTSVPWGDSNKLCRHFQSVEAMDNFHAMWIVAHILSMTLVLHIHIAPKMSHQQALAL